MLSNHLTVGVKFAGLVIYLNNIFSVLRYNKIAVFFTAHAKDAI